MDTFVKNVEWYFLSYNPCCRVTSGRPMRPGNWWLSSWPPSPRSSSSPGHPPHILTFSTRPMLFSSFRTHKIYISRILKKEISITWQFNWHVTFSHLFKSPTGTITWSRCFLHALVHMITPGVHLSPLTSSPPSCSDITYNTHTQMRFLWRPS